MRFVLVGLGILSLVAVAAGYAVKRERLLNYQFWEARTSGIAEDRARMVSSWLKSRVDNAQLIACFPSVTALLGTPRRRKPFDSEDNGHLTQILDTASQIHSLTGIYILDPEGLILARSTNALSVPTDWIAGIRSAIQTGEPRIEFLGEIAGEKALAFIAPVRPGKSAPRTDASPGASMASVIVLVDAGQDLFPLLTKEIIETRSGETLLVRREGDWIEFISPLESSTVSHLPLRRPLSTSNSAARAALEGKEVFGEFIDYRGERVFAATRRILLADWGLVRKIDLSEAREAYHRAAKWIVLAATLLAFVLIGLFWGVRGYELTRVLKEEAGKFRNLLEAAPDGILIGNEIGQIELTNQPAADMLGYSREELIQRPVVRLVAERSRTQFQAEYQRFLSGSEGGSTSRAIELNALRRDGSTLPVEINFSLHRTNAEVFVISAFRDITERKRAEEALRRSEEHFRSLFENMLNGFAYCQMLYEDGRPSDFIYLEVNSAFQKLTGLKEVVGRRVSEVIPGIRESDPGLLEAYGRVALTRVPEQFEIYVGSMQMWFSISVYSPKSEHFVAVFDAITERKRAEEEILKLNRELETRVAARTAELEAANKELEAFTYSVSHDLRAPLRHIDGFSKLLVDENLEGLSEDSKRYLARIREGTKHMGQLVDDLLNLARVGRKEIRLQAAGLTSLARAAAEEIKRENPSRRIDWKIEPLPFVECDPGLIKQVFVNLLSNAAKYSRPRPHALIEVGTINENGQPILFVRDNGVGFSMKYADKLFGVFQRLHRSEDFEGTGIGLATVQRILHKHGGRIWAEAELDKGATFYFTCGAVDGQKMNNRVHTAEGQRKVA